MLNRFLLASICLVFTVGCDKEKEKGKSTYAKLTVANSTTDSANLTANTYTPSVFGLKLIDVRIMQELDTTQHPAPVIWYNPECGTATTTATEIDGKEYEYTQSPGCDLSKVSNYFDFARPTAEVNAELNSQPNKVYPETYKYVSITWCAGDMPSDSIEFQAEGMDAPAYVAAGGCGQRSAEAVPPIVIGEGETITVSLDYSIEGIVIDQGDHNCYVNGDIKRCISMPEFRPTATKD